jgi:hypothetical protein
MKRSSIVVVFLLCFLCGCGSADVPSTNSFNEEKLGRAIQPGMPKQAVIDYFGKPDSVIENKDRSLRFDYFFPINEKHGARSSFVSGVTIFLNSDKVSRWAPIYHSGSQGKTDMVLVQPKNPNTDLSRSISFWIVSGDPIVGGKYIDTEKLPKLGYIPKDSALTINSVKSLEQPKEPEGEEKAIPGRLVLEIGLEEEDALAFQTLTRLNLKKRILLMIGSDPVIAPYIIAPVASGVIRVPCDNLTEMRRFRDELAQLLPLQ